MSHGDSVAYRDRRKYNRDAACFRNAQFNCIYNFIQIHMARYDLIIGAYDTDHRLFHFFFCEAKCIEKASMRCLLHSAFYIITFHLFYFLSLYHKTPEFLHTLRDQITHLLCSDFFDRSTFFRFLRHNIDRAVSLF